MPIAVDVIVLRDMIHKDNLLDQRCDKQAKKVYFGAVNWILFGESKLFVFKKLNEDGRVCTWRVNLSPA